MNSLFRHPLQRSARGVAWAVCLLALLISAFAGSAAQSLRPPAVPLVTHDPYFSIWSAADSLTGAETTHWTGRPHRLGSLVRIDGQTFRLMGLAPSRAPALPQSRLEVTPTRTRYTFRHSAVELTLTFLTPALPDDLDILSRPVTYLAWEVVAIDGQEHRVELYFDADPELAVNDPGQSVVASQLEIAGLQVRRLGSADQPVLQKKGDDLRIDWGQLHLATTLDSKARVGCVVLTQAREHFASNGALPPGPETSFSPQPARSAPGLAASFDLGRVGNAAAFCWLMLAYDDEYSIQYFKQNLRPFWRRHGDDAAALLRKAAADFPRLQERCTAFDGELVADLRRAGGEAYAQLCTLAYRQTLAGNKIVADANGQPLMFPKENFSNGCIGTVDVLFPQAPFFLTFSPGLTKAMLRPVLDYARSDRWPYAYAPHDLGTYPHANGQVYGMGGSDGDRMPVEESGNMLILLAALARVEGDARFVGPYWPMLTQWADYLVKEGLDPQNQLCSADMFGHLPRAANLALKAIIAIGAYAQLCILTERPAEARKYQQIAREYAAQWLVWARDDGRTRLAYHLPGTWGMKHNLIWDRFLGLGLFPDTVADEEIAWYLKVQNRYGLPVDNRTDTSLIDWALWSIAPARRPADFQALLQPIWQYVHETPTRVPLSDWFVTTSAERKGFQARPVVGGLLIKLLTDDSAREKWSRRGAQAAGPWAPLPAVRPQRPLLPTAPQAAGRWRFTTSPPPDTWVEPAFDDADWREGQAAFGTEGTPGAIVGTRWNQERIWLRRTFELPNRPLRNPRLMVLYDEAPTIFLNGVPAAKLTGWSTAYEEVPISPAAAGALHPGKNLIAVQASQTYGGQAIDVGIVEDADPLPVRRLFDHPVRDTSICLGPDGVYYLTGTTAAKTGGPDVKDGWWYLNEGIRLWKSPDLVEWTALGLVWSFEKDATWQRPIRDGRRALWAPDIHYLRGTYWLTYCLNWPGGGTGLLKSTTGKPGGPYVDVKKDGPITPEIDASLFEDRDGKVYFVFQNGKIARLNEDLTDLAESPRLLAPTNAQHVGFEGAFLTRMNGRYTLVCAEFNTLNGLSTYDCMVAHADHLEGPYGDRYLAIPHAGHNMFFQDAQGEWWATFFGNDAAAPWRERPGVLPIELGPDGRVRLRQP